MTSSSVKKSCREGGREGGGREGGRREGGGREGGGREKYVEC